MKKTFSISSLLFLFVVLLQGGLLAANKKDKKQQDDAKGYLKHVFPTQLTFGIDPLPADRMMLITKAPQTLKPPVPPSPALDLNVTVTTDPPVVPEETIDPPVSTLVEPTLPVSASSLVLPQSGFRGSTPGSSTIVTSDEVLQLLQLGNESTLKSKHGIVVPFEMPYSQAPSSAVLSSRGRYIKRIK